MNRKITINTSSKEFPKFIEKETNSDRGWIECLVEITNGNIWTGRVIRMNSSGKYEVELLEKKPI